MSEHYIRTSAGGLVFMLPKHIGKVGEGVDGLSGRSFTKGLLLANEHCQQCLKFL